MELIVVLTIIAILSAAVVPVFRGSLLTVSTDHAIRDLVAVLKYAQERAVTDMREYRLYIDPDNRAYQIKSLARIEGEDKQFEPIRERQGAVMYIPERLDFRKPSARTDRGAGLYYVAFYANGACDEAKLTLEEDRGHSFTIETHGRLGRIELKENQR